MVRSVTLIASLSLLFARGACVAQGVDTARPPRELPLVPMRASGDGHVLALVFTGDGDWADIDQTIARVLNENGIAVVGLKARAYLSRARTPEETSRDVERALRHYMDEWRRDTIVLVGYSRGADIVPFVANRLSDDLRGRLALVAMLGPARYASFTFHMTDLISDKHRASDLPTGPEIARLRGTRMLCVYGREEKESLCAESEPALMRVVAKDGKHHFDKDYRALGELIVAELRGR